MHVTDYFSLFTLPSYVVPIGHGKIIEFKLVYSSPMIAGQGLSYMHTITVDMSADARL
jgi:hypothetical protein